MKMLLLAMSIPIIPIIPKVINLVVIFLVIPFKSLKAGQFKESICRFPVHSYKVMFYCDMMHCLLFNFPVPVKVDGTHGDKYNPNDTQSGGKKNVCARPVLHLKSCQSHFDGVYTISETNFNRVA